MPPRKKAKKVSFPPPHNTYPDILRYSQAKSTAREAAISTPETPPIIPFPSTPPHEVIQRIYTYTDKPTLATGLRVSRACFDICGRLLYHTLNIDIPKRQSGQRLDLSRLPFSKLDYPSRFDVPLATAKPSRLSQNDQDSPRLVIKDRLLSYTKRLVFERGLCFSGEGRKCETCRTPRHLPNLEVIIVRKDGVGCACDSWLRAERLVLHCPIDQPRFIRTAIALDITICQKSNDIKTPGYLPPLESITIVFGNHESAPSSQAHQSGLFTGFGYLSSALRNIIIYMVTSRKYLRLVNIREAWIEHLPHRRCKKNQDEWEAHINGAVDRRFPANLSVRQELKDRLTFLTMEEYLAEEGGHEDVMDAEAVHRYRVSVDAEKNELADPYWIE
jgi:hypothetical protein